MKATVDGKLIADSGDVIECAGYRYFPEDAVRREWLEKTERTPKDLECPHGVQFYDVVIGGKRYPRNAWQYEAPQPRMQPTKNRIGFWKDVAVG